MIRGLCRHRRAQAAGYLRRGLHRALLSSSSSSSSSSSRTKSGSRLSKWGRRTVGAVAVVGGTSVCVQQYAVYDRSVTREDGLSLRYDPQQVEDFWGNHRAQVLLRFATIATAAAPVLAAHWWRTRVTRPLSRNIAADGSRPDSRPEGDQELDEEQQYLVLLARDACGAVVGLGPLFVKFGQVLSSRPDLFSEPVLCELRKLCDSVKAFPTSQALDLVEEQLQKPVHQVFVDLGPASRPIAAASLGQVYRCRLRSTGRTVALKVQRPDMLRAVTLDMFLLRAYYRFVEYVKEHLMEHGYLQRRRQFDVDMFDTFAKASLNELDYVHEAQNQIYFRDQLLSKMGGDVYVPELFWEATTEKVLCSEWIDGTPLASAPPDEIRRLVPVGVKCFLLQLLRLGKFHADPHPGNLFVESEVAPDCKSGRRRLVLLDFGLCADLEEFSMSRLGYALVHLVQGDIDNLLQDAIALGFLEEGVDLEKLGPEMKAVLKHAQRLAGKAASSQALHIAKGDSNSATTVVQRRRKSLASISTELNDIFFRYPFLVPEYFALVTRALIALEGIALKGEPDFDIFKSVGKAVPGIMVAW